MKCTICGREIGDNAKFCRYCGSPVDLVKSDIEMTNSVICSKCGAVVKSGAAFCTKCGTPIKKDTNRQNNKYNAKKSEQKKRRKTVKILIISLTVTVVILIGVIFLYFAIQNGLFEKKDKGEPDTSYTKKTEAPKETDWISETADVSSPSPSEINSRADALVLLYDTEYESMKHEMLVGNYEQLQVEEGIIVYTENDALRAIIVNQSSDKSTKEFYYENDTLFYAEYSGNDYDKFYFDNSEMIRWSHSNDSSDSQSFTNYDDENTTSYIAKEKSVIDDSNQVVEEWNVKKNEVSNSDFKLPGSDIRYIDKSELNNFTAEDCSIARNEIYARHGRKFKDDKLQAYFNQFDWYKPSIDPDAFQESMLNEYEKKNRDLIVEYEKEHGFR